MKINTSSAVSLTTFRLKKGYQNELIKAKIPSFVQERIEYFAKYLSKGMTFSDLYMFVAAESDEEGLATMFEEIFASPYLDMSDEFMKWCRDPNNWRQRQVDLANAVIHVYQQKTRKERMII
ncbi:TPA: hypothetical protein ACQDSE_001444 [Enterococcus faecium]|uniref:hypothetical protein n=1 Tax=Enterococcus faecium TaxID=1352 RepID=UPI000F50D609|nr:hypothetical protein [Enterococcus faecium]ROY63029.1 hypothetical protein EGX20_09650 [Enterococcus faecium]HBM5450696.1 hypothetical protein [Enterococcus faecium]HBM5600363.1 hypothetical protein [Enterococcus faecium]HBM5612217.1 hypothetical protein [Enterococcus faecium]HBM6221204.1 hypothetical protein [Enterococcus faecium]